MTCLAKKLSPKLSARVYLKRTGKGQCPFVSVCVIKLGDMPVANFTVGGKYSEEQALAYFKKNKEKFGKAKGHNRGCGWDMAWSIGAV